MEELKPTKVYVPVDVKIEQDVEKLKSFMKKWVMNPNEHLWVLDFYKAAQQNNNLKEQEGYFFTKEELKDQLVCFLLHLNGKGLINNHDFDYDKQAKKYINQKLK